MQRGTVFTLLLRPATATPSRILSTTTSNTLLLQANLARRGATVFNDSTAVLTLLLGDGQSATVFTTQLAAGAYYEIPFGFTGNITGAWAAVNGAAQITELS